MPVLRLLLCYLDGLHQIRNGLVEGHVVGFGTLLEVLDRQIVWISMVIVGEHAATGETHWFIPQPLDCLSQPETAQEVALAECIPSGQARVDRVGSETAREHASRASNPTNS
jgi:hypothetical protein